MQLDILRTSIRHEVHALDVSMQAGDTKDAPAIIDKIIGHYLELKGKLEAAVPASQQLESTVMSAQQAQALTAQRIAEAREQIPMQQPWKDVVTTGGKN